MVALPQALLLGHEVDGVLGLEGVLGCERLGLPHKALLSGVVLQQQLVERQLLLGQHAAVDSCHLSVACISLRCQCLPALGQSL